MANGTPDGRSRSAPRATNPYSTTLIAPLTGRQVPTLSASHMSSHACKVVPAAELMTEALVWGKKIAAMSPTAIKLAKASFNAPSEEIRGIGAVALRALALYYETEEALEGKNAFLEKRAARFSGR